MYSTFKPDRKAVLGWLREEDILERYTGVPVQWIGNRTEKFPSPFRRDRHPSCGYLRALPSGKIFLWDYSTHQRWDCFDVVALLNPTMGFQQILELVLKEFGIWGLASTTPPPVREQQILLADEPTMIAVRRRAWNLSDQLYWQTNGIRLDTCEKFNIAPIAQAWIDDKCVYGESKSDPGYCYQHGPGEYKLYFPLRPRSRTRFYSNGSWIFGKHCLPESGDHLMLSKSLKDTCLLHQHGFHSLPRPSEGYLFPEEEVLPYGDYFKHFWTMCDWDRAGCHSMWLERKTYNAIPVPLTTGWMNTTNYGAKDLTDYHAAFGAEKTTTLLSALHDRMQSLSLTTLR